MESIKWNGTLRNEVVKIFTHYYLEYTPKTSTWYVVFISLVANLMVILLFYDRLVDFWIDNWMALKTKIRHNPVQTIERTRLEAVHKLLYDSKKLPIVEFSKSGIIWDRTPDRQRKDKQPTNQSVSDVQFRSTRRALYSQEHTRMLAKFYNTRKGIVNRMAKRDLNRVVISDLLERIAK
ncbi:hypothetical protein M3Y94_00655600 [Aphelenchoides besseyi]|nr:hypothetical protein M3Y94_00655600 [Aphelenchoides besseyi]